MTDCDKEFIVQNYESMKTKEIAEYLGYSQDLVRQIARNMGLYRRKDADLDYCKGCMVFCNGVCLARLDKCGAARYTKAKWSDLLKK